MDDETQGHIFRLASWLTDPTDTHFGVMLIGGVGNGKTTMLHALKKGYWLMMLDESYRYQAEYRLDIVNAKMLTDTHKTWNRLGIDELGVEPIEVQEYGNITTPSSDVLTYRYDRRLPTFVTTNMAQRPEDGETLRQRYGNRLADRFNEMFFVIGFYGPSYR
jgi:DNA replication protein DnaC